MEVSVEVAGGELPRAEVRGGDAVVRYVVQHLSDPQLVVQGIDRIDRSDLDPAAGGSGEERLGPGCHRRGADASRRPCLVVTLPKVQLGVIAPDHGEATRHVQRCESHPPHVEVDCSVHLAHRQRGDRP